MTNTTQGKTKQELRNAYKERKVVGGVYAIKNTVTGRMLLLKAADLKGAENRFIFSKDNPKALNLKLMPDIKEHGTDIFAFEVLEELNKKPTQTDKEFSSDLDELLELWQEKLGEQALY